MDPFTQGALGAAAAQAISKPKEARHALYCGVPAAMAPDLDVFINSSSDPLVYFQYHRHFTHSLAFIPIGALLVSIPLYFLLRKKLSIARVYLYSFAGWATHGLLDACTSYGTWLFWPFSDIRVAWDIIAIVDPVFTLPLLIFVVLAFTQSRARWAQVGLAIGLLYLMLGVVQRQRAESAITELAAKRQHTPSMLTVKPTIMNLWLFRSIYEYQGRFYVDAVNIAGFGPPKIYAGETVKAFSVQEDLPNLDKDSRLYRDIKIFNHFSNGYLASAPDDGNSLGDIRYAMLPNEIEPLWGIRINPDQPEQAVEAFHINSITDEKKTLFLRMLRRKPIPTP